MKKLPKQQNSTRQEVTRKAPKRKIKVKDVKDDVFVTSREGAFYHTRDGSLMAVLKIAGTSGVARFTPMAYQSLIDAYTSGIRTLHLPFNFVILDFLVDHRKQIDFYEHKKGKLDLSKPVDCVKYYWLDQEVKKLEFRQLHATKEQYFVLLFDETKEGLEAQIRLALEIPYLNCQQASQNEKDALIFKLNNLNSSPYNLLRGEAHG